MMSITQNTSVAFDTKTHKLCVPTVHYCFQSLQKIMNTYGANDANHIDGM
jgi:hypothetical protein